MTEPEASIAERVACRGHQLIARSLQFRAMSLQSEAMSLQCGAMSLKCASSGLTQGPPERYQSLRLEARRYSRAGASSVELGATS